MSLRTSDRRHWCGSPPVGWKQLGFTAKMFENPGDCARRKYPWGTTPACALVRNDRAFSNSPFLHYVLSRSTRVWGNEICTGLLGFPAAAASMSEISIWAAFSPICLAGISREVIEVCSIPPRW